jgi:predicted negative regulator of RcsB-dependent stress response
MDIRSNAEKTLWEQYGKFVIIGLIIFAAAYGGREYYQHQQTQQSVEASLIYDGLLVSMRKNDPAKVRADAEIIKQKYSRTPYAPLAALLMAKLDIEENKLEAAIDHLKQAMQYDEKGPAHQIARIRLARVMAAGEKFTEALELLNPKTIPDGFVTLYEETKGDIYMMQNEKDKARAAYQAAQMAAPPGVPLVRLQLKQTDLGNN